MHRATKISFLLMISCTGDLETVEVVEDVPGTIAVKNCQFALNTARTVSALLTVTYITKLTRLQSAAAVSLLGALHVSIVSCRFSQNIAGEVGLFVAV